MHFPIAVSAIRRGKHVYCQKPMCHDVAEVRALTEAAAKHGVVTQLGTQLASGAGDRTTVAWLRQGVVGKVNASISAPTAPGPSNPIGRSDPAPPGPAAPGPLHGTTGSARRPERPFAPELYHPTRWRGWLNFGTGWSGDIGCHIFDAVWKGLGLGAPKSVQARGPGILEGQSGPSCRHLAAGQSSHLGLPGDHGRG